jgi:hypothetical protein
VSWLPIEHSPNKEQILRPDGLGNGPANGSPGHLTRRPREAACGL